MESEAVAIRKKTHRGRMLRLGLLALAVALPAACDDAEVEPGVPSADASAPDVAPTATTTASVPATDAAPPPPPPPPPPECTKAADCSSRICTAAGKCAAASNSDGVQNNDETDVDCGGIGAKPCTDGM